MANFIMHVLVEFVFSDSYMYFALSLNAIIIKLHDEAIYIYMHIETTMHERYRLR
jgi:hypothetical protein